MKNNKGFTLIEVILAMTILSSMMILVSISISRASKAKVKIQAEVEAVAALRDSMRVIRNDINQAYNHFDFELEILDQSKKTATTAGIAAGASAGSTLKNPSVPTANPVQAAVATPSQRKSPSTQFVGTENTLNFVTMNNGRMTANEVQADFIEVGYFLQNCKTSMGDGGKGVEKKSQGTQCLYRRTQKVIDHDVTKGGDEIVILEDVTEFALKYLVEDKLDWLKEWKADKKRYNIFPDAVEVTLGIEKELDGKQRKYSIQYVVPIHFPNNVKATGSAPAAGTTSVEGGEKQ